MPGEVRPAAGDAEADPKGAATCTASPSPCPYRASSSRTAFAFVTPCAFRNSSKKARSPNANPGNGRVPSASRRGWWSVQRRMDHATGLMSAATASHPSRIASSRATVEQLFRLSKKVDEGCRNRCNLSPGARIHDLS